MVDGEANDVLCNEETEPVESLLSKLPEPEQQQEQQPEQQPEPEQPKPKAKAKPKGRPPPKAGETTPLRPRLREKTTCPDCNKQISNHALHYTHSKVCKGKAEPSIVLEDIKPDEPIEQPKAKAKTVKAVTTSIEANPVEVVKELRTVDLSENEMKEVLLKYAKTVKDKQKQEKQKKYKSLLDGKLNSK